MRIALATCRSLPDWEVDDAPFEAALADRGIEIFKPAWDDAGFDWSNLTACLIRTTWDYAARRDEFVAWAGRVGAATTLFNPPHVVRWNTDKRYLRDIERAGVPTIPTIWLERDRRYDVGALIAENGWNRAFIKPVVGASASGTLRFECDSAGIATSQAHLDSILSRCDAMLQPYYSSVESEGETSVVFIDGAISHCVRKVPVPGDYRVQDDFGAHDEPASLGSNDLKAAQLAMSAVGEPPLYGRVDFLRDAEGGLRMNELELVEPSLFFRHAPAAAEKLAAGLIRRVMDAQRITRAAEST